MLSALGEPPVSGNRSPAWAAGAAISGSGQRYWERTQEAATSTTFGHEGREYKERGGPFAPRVAVR